MKEIKTTFERFDLNSLIEKTLDFAKGHFKPYFAIPWIYESGDSPVYHKDENAEIDYDNIPEYAERDYSNELLNEGKSLFFTFSESNIGDPIACADGNSYIIDEDSVLNEEFGLGDTECIGYLLKYYEGSLTINSAINASGSCTAPSSVCIIKNCGIFDVPMLEFIKKFI